MDFNFKNKDNEFTEYIFDYQALEEMTSKCFNCSNEINVVKRLTVKLWNVWLILKKDLNEAKEMLKSKAEIKNPNSENQEITPKPENLVKM